MIHNCKHENIHTYIYIYLRIICISAIPAPFHPPLLPPPWLLLRLGRSEQRLELARELSESGRAAARRCCAESKDLKVDWFGWFDWDMFFGFWKNHRFFIWKNSWENLENIWVGWLVVFFLPLNSFRFYRGSETLKVSQVAVRQIWRFSRLTIDNLNLTSMAGIWLIHLLKMVLKSSVKKVYIGVLGGWFGWVLFFPPKNRGKRGVRKSTLFETTNKLRSHQFIWEDWSNWMTTNNMSMPITIETLILGCNPLTLFGVI